MKAMWLRLILVLSVILPAVVAAEERIIHFESDIRVRPSAQIEVTENITVKAEGRQIPHGIFRDIATDYRDRLTIAVTWPKGYIQEPSGRDILRFLLADNLPLIIGLSVLGLLLAYYLWVWFLSGRDPRAGVIVPRYRPPEGYSPASMRFVRRMGYDTRALSPPWPGSKRMTRPTGRTGTEAGVGNHPRRPVSPPVWGRP